MMVELIKKDFISGWMFLLGIFIIIPFITWMAIWAMVDDFGGVIFGIFFFLILFMCLAASLLLILYDISLKTDMIFASLPLKRSTIILARYVSSVLILTSSFFLILLTSFIAVHLFQIEDKVLDLLLNVRIILGTFTFLIIFLSFMFPFLFKFGPGWGTMIALIVLVILFSAESLIEFLKNVLQGTIEVDLSFIGAFFQVALKWMNSVSIYQTFLFQILIVLLLIYISIKFSIHFFNYRDL